ncbi:MAG: DNA polymerase III subunit delta [Gammaproteobacteria bacterium]
MAQCYPNRLTEQLADKLAPVYFIYGNEALVQMECADAIRAQARQQGFTERQVFSVDAGFDWNQLAAESSNLSLFAQKRLLELRIPSGKPGREGSKALCDFIDPLPDDTLLLITVGKLETSAKNTRWFKSLNAAGISVPVYPIDIDRLPGWVSQRFGQKGMLASQAAIQLLVQRTEGNLLACVQEIEKLFLLYGTAAIDEEAVEASVADSARYTAFQLVDAACVADVGRCQRILAGLKAEAVAPTLVLWALSKEIHSLGNMAIDMKNSSLASVLSHWHVWEKRKPIVTAALNRLSSRQLLSLVSYCSRVDRVIKGRLAGNPWDELLQLSMKMSGVSL